MKQEKAIFTSLFALTITAALLFFGCPGPSSNPISNPEYIITRAPVTGTERGQIEISATKAAPGTIIQIKTTPTSGYTVDTITVKDSANWSVPLTRKAENTWTFAMPAANVVVDGVFDTYLRVLRERVKNMGTTSSWEEIGYINTLIERIEHETDSIWDYDAEIYKFIEKIEKKMDVEDLRYWFPGAKFASHGIDYPKDTWEPSKTHVYFVMTQNDNKYPSLSSLDNGWKAYPPVNAWVSDPLNIPLLVGVDPAIKEIKLVYDVGYTPFERIEFTLWLVPVAQYTVSAVGTVTTNFTIQSHFYFDGSLANGDMDSNTVTPSGAKVLTDLVGSGVYTKIDVHYSETPDSLLFTVIDEKEKTLFNKETTVEFDPTSQLYKIEVRNNAP